MYRLQNAMEEAVSPVVGVMLMLVVTIIIAAVVSAYSGGITKGEEKPPTASVELHIVNDGTWGGSYYDLIVKSTSEPIRTKDIKLTTLWTASDGTSGGVTVTGPNVTTTNFANTHTNGKAAYHSPLGFGPGVNASSMTSGSGPNSNFWPDQMYGNYSLMAGTRMHNSAYGYSKSLGGYGVDPSTRFKYTDGTGYVYTADRDAMQAVLGQEWWHLRPGDIVNVKLIHIPSGKLIFDKKIAVEG
jgi:archaeal type IV pilus assembly protein PilA